MSFRSPFRPAQCATDRGSGSSPRGFLTQVDDFAKGFGVLFSTGVSPARARPNTAGERSSCAALARQQQLPRRNCRASIRTGRRLMRHTILPKTRATIAPGRRDQVARRPGASWRSARCSGLLFGLPLTPESGGPSPVIAARVAPADRRVLRRRELSYAEQDVDRCHPSGRNPGRGGPRQPCRRI